ncbi:hypothetical protein CKA32_004099 [Geitlerinema sp. FC II]|nr:hypothetical protein CKA32_004099 [Geitlerinema sp. FC II]
MVNFNLGAESNNRRLSRFQSLKGILVNFNYDRVEILIAF